MTLATEAQFFSGEDQGIIDHTPGSNMALGEIRRIGTLGQAIICNIVGGIASGVLGAVCTKGKWKIKKPTSVTTFTAGDRVWWDASADTAITASGEAADILLGTALKDAAAADDHVLVDLNEQGLFVDTT